MSIGSFLRPSSSSTIADLPPAPNSQTPTQVILQTQPDSSKHINTEPPSRPITACQDPQALNQLLPPKRDLPFSKPAAKKPRTTKRQGDKTSTEAQPPPPTPDPKSTKTRDSKAATNNNNNKRNAKRSLTSLPQSNLSTELHSSSSQHTTQANTNTSAQPTLPVMQQAPLLTNTNMNTIPTHHQCIITPSLSDHIVPQQQQQQQQHQQQPDPAPDLSSYTIAPMPERIMHLENWICEHIQDDGFLKLCQDMEGVWKRVAFGG